jgi:hypothetical protein
VKIGILSSFTCFLKKINVTGDVILKCGTDVISNHSSMLKDHSGVVVGKEICIGESGLYFWVCSG